MTFPADINLNDPRLKWVFLAVTIGAMFIFVVRPAMRRKKDPLAKSPAATSLARQRNVERQMESLLVELSEMSRQLTASLDTRAAKLEALIDEADKRIATLNSLAERPPANTRPFESHAPPVAPPRPAVDDRYKKIYQLADEGRSAGEIARSLDQPRGEIELILALRQTA